MNLVWEGVEKSDRRKHNHRCGHCRRILNDGDAALFYRKSKGTLAVHIECADLKEFELTTRERWTQWAGGGRP